MKGGRKEGIKQKEGRKEGRKDTCAFSKIEMWFNPVVNIFLRKKDRKEGRQEGRKGGREEGRVVLQNVM